ncbi:MAG: DNA polymerase III subunit delta [Chloroflexi bacterium]|nr:DNA polymerase III subunit delta [Chloroflexota bacterium]
MGRAYVFHGEDEFSVAEAVAQVKGTLGPRETVDANTVTLDGMKVSFGELRHACDTIPFFAEYRLVVIPALLERFEESGQRRGRKAKAQEKGLGDWEALAPYLKGLPAPTTLIITGGALDSRRRNALLDSIRQTAQVRVFSAPRGGQLVEWLNARAQRLGATLKREATRLLADFSGGNLRLLDQELAKVCTYANGQPVTDEMVRKLVTSAREARIFDLMDAVAQRRQSDAMRSLEQLYVQGEAPPYILTMLVRQVRQMVQAKSLTASGADRQAFFAALETGSDFVVDKSVEQSRSYTMDDLMTLYKRLLDTDLSIKTGQLEQELALELLVADSAGAAAR